MNNKILLSTYVINIDTEKKPEPLDNFAGGEDLFDVLMNFCNKIYKNIENL